MLETTRTGRAGARPPGRHPLTPAAGAPGGSIGRWRPRRSPAQRMRGGWSGSCRRWGRCRVQHGATFAGTRGPAWRCGRQRCPAASRMRAWRGCRRSSASTRRRSPGSPTGWRARSARRRWDRRRRARSSRRPRSRPMAHGDIARATELAAVLALEVAAVMLLAWVFQLGFLADLLSRPVLVGFTAAMSLVIIAAQLPNLLGVSGVTPGPSRRRSVGWAAVGPDRRRLGGDRRRRARRAARPAPTAPALAAGAARGRRGDAAGRASSDSRTPCTSSATCRAGCRRRELPSVAYEDVERLRPCRGRHRADRVRRDDSDRADVRGRCTATRSSRATSSWPSASPTSPRARSRAIPPTRASRRPLSRTGRAAGR